MTVCVCDAFFPDGRRSGRTCFPIRGLALDSVPEPVVPIDPEWADAPVPMTLDDDTARAVANFLRDKVDDATFAQVMQMMSSAMAEDDPPPFPGRPRVGGGQDPIKRNEQAMDYSIARKIAMDAATRNAVQTMNAIREAEAIVAPYTGAPSMAFDSAEGVFGEALERMGHDISRLHPSGRRAAFDMLKTTRTTGRSYPSSKGLLERFPEAKRIGY
jgi:hypothetical protein